MKGVAGLLAYNTLQDLYRRNKYARKMTKDFWALKFKTQKKYKDIEDMCIDNNVSINTYINKAAEAINKPLSSMTVDIYSKAQTMAAFLGVTSKRSAPAKIWCRQVKTYQNRLCLIPDRYLTNSLLLEDPHQPFLPWFRVIFSINPSDWLLKTYKPAAMAELTHKPDLLSYLQELELMGLVHLNRLGETYTVL